MNHTCIEVRHPSPERTEVWLNRPEVRNAFNDAMIAELTQAFAAIARDRRVRVVLLAAQGKAFCAGADLNWMRAMADYSWDPAQAMGLVHEVSAPDALDASTEAMLDTLIANGPDAVRACKRLVRDVEGRPIDEALRGETARRIADIRASDEGKEGLQSFLNKRAPNWLVP